MKRCPKLTPRLDDVVRDGRLRRAPANVNGAR